MYRRIPIRSRYKKRKLKRSPMIITTMMSTAATAFIIFFGFGKGMDERRKIERIITLIIITNNETLIETRTTRIIVAAEAGSPIKYRSFFIR